VPRVVPRTEQLIRAEAFAKLGLLRCIRPDELTADRLLAEVDASLELSRETLAETARTRLGFEGAEQAARHLLALSERVTSRQPVDQP
jgi:predicted glycosyltransferase